MTIAAVLATTQPDFQLEYDKLNYQDVQFALPNGQPDRSKPVNSWIEVRLSRRLLTSFSNGVDTPQSQHFSSRSIGSIYRYESEPLPKGVQPFTLPEPGSPVLNIHKPKSTYVSSREMLAPMHKHTVYAVDQARTQIEYRFYKGKEYLRYETTNSILRYEESITSIK